MPEFAPVTRHVLPFMSKLSSLVIVQPGQTRVVQFFGSYVGTVRHTGLSWIIPLTNHRGVSVRVRNFETNHLKVNDAEGNPVEIAAIVVWQVTDTSRALYAVDEATLRVTGYHAPDPLLGLLPRLAPAFAWEDLRRALVSRIAQGEEVRSIRAETNVPPQARAQATRPVPGTRASFWRS